MSSATVQRAIADDSELKLHLASGENTFLRDSEGRVTPPESGAVVVMDIHTGEMSMGRRQPMTRISPSAGR